MDFELSALEQAEQVRIEQNKQLLRVLEEEQQAEAHREQRMRQIKSTEEKQRLEKIFGTWERQAMRETMRVRFVWKALGRKAGVGVWRDEGGCECGEVEWAVCPEWNGSV